ncbi:MAG: PQQ-dependent sugar dehydrogenase [Gammaproteobacteria bacterium]|nr:PQQ-dependent sugar dehydrogenase [Gammaproteobacteria bacterium]
MGALRHIAVAGDGTLYAALSRQENGGGIALLRDTDGDGRADSVRYFGDVRGTGIALHRGYLYFGETTRILRFKLSPETGLPQGEPQTVVAALPDQRQHSARGMAFDGAGHLYVDIGAPSNACQKRDRHPHSKGMDPCPLLENHGGIWRFSADKTGQRFSADHRYATGLRHTIALAWNHAADALFGVMMGRDQLHGNWPELYTVKENAELPAEEFVRIDRGDNFGWPYCYYDGFRNKLVLAPEYGGNGEKVGRCKKFEAPLVAFPAHWAPEAMVFYTGEAFPPEYRGGAFVAFHGSWNRAPLPQQGFVVAFVPFDHGKPSGHWQVFAKGFAGEQKLSSPSQARFRPVGVAVGPQGALYIADSERGWIWRVTWTGNEGTRD